MTGTGGQARARGDAAVFALPDFLDFAETPAEASFAVSTSTRVADGGILVFPDAVLLVTGAVHDRLPIDGIESWSVELDEAAFTVIVQAEAAHATRLPIAFLAPTVDALEAALGPPEVG